MEEKVFEGLRYLISYPEGFREDRKYPLVMFLHGAGTRASLERLRNNENLVHILERQNSRGYIFLAPWCNTGNWYEWMQTLIGLVGVMREKPYVDETRLHVTGNSMGGYGTWEFTSLRPDWVASAMPICGGGIGGFAKNLVNVPIRTFHGLCDTRVDPIESLQMAKAVNQAGGYVELILFPHLKHNCWDAVYTDESNFDWLLSFTNQRDKAEPEDLSGAAYG